MIRNTNLPFKLMDCIVWSFANNLSIDVTQIGLIFEIVVEIFLSIFDLKVSFSIKIFSLNVAASLFVTRVEQEQVSRNVLIALNLQNVSHMKLLPLLLDKLTILKALYLLLVFLCITLMPFIVFVGILDHGYADDDYQGNGHDGLAIGDGDALDRLHEGDD